MDGMVTLRLFTRVVETGSFSKAAKAEGVVQSTVSKQMAALEKRLGVQLLRRTSRGLSVTDAGHSYHDAVIRALDQIDEVEAMLGGGSPTGLIRATVPAAFGRMYVVPALKSFFARYPGLRVDVDVTDRYQSLVEEGIDLAIRIGDLNDSTLLARRIGSFAVATLATPEFLAQHGTPLHPEEIAAMPCVTFMSHGSPLAWRYRGPDGPIQIAPVGQIRTNDAENVRAAVLDSQGLARAPGWLFGPEIASGAVVRVLQEFESLPAPIHAVTPAARQTSGRVKLLIDHIADHFSREPCLRLN